MVSRSSALALLLRFIGLGELCALAAVLTPGRWLVGIHGWLGLGEMPQTPVVAYLARSASALYALHGALLLFLSFDVEHYRRLIAFLAYCALVYGLIVLGIDVVEGLPLWWVLSEGPFSLGTGALVLFLQHGAANRPSAGG